MAPMLICTFSFSENYNPVSCLIRCLYPYGRILSEQELGLLSGLFLWAQAIEEKENEGKINAYLT